jgi:hypothetical protein
MGRPSLDRGKRKVLTLEHEEEWEEIHGFQSPDEFQRFRQWVAEAVDEGALEEVAVGAPYSGSLLFNEWWYRTSSGERWRVVAPEPPFLGVFERVT